MREHTNALSRRAFLGGVVLFGAASLLSPQNVFATPTSAEKQAEADAVRNQLVGLQADLEAAAGKYWAAVDEQEAAQAAMEAEQAKIDAATAQIEKLQDLLSLRARSMYRSGSVSFLDFLLGSNSFEELTQNWDLLNQLNENDQKMVAQTKDLREQLQAAKEEYQRQEKIAAEKAAEAKVIKDEAQRKVDEAQALVNKLDAEAQELMAAEQAAAAAAAAAEAERRRQEEEERRRQEAAANGGNSGDGSGVPSYGLGGPPVPSYGSVVDYAYSRIGCPYVWGGGGPNEFDCSGLVQWCYAQIGIWLPHYTEDLYACATQRVPVSEARPGDVLYRYGHVGIAAGYGGVPYVHAPTFNAYVRDTDSLAWSGFTCALRFG